MTYAAGQTIQDDEFNTFVQGAPGAVDHNTANVNTVWATGTGDKGYGQATPLATVTPGDTITGTEWANLLTRMETIADHQGTTLSAWGVTTPAAGVTITYDSVFQGNLNSVFNNRRDCAASGTTITTGGDRVGTNTWYVSQETVYTVSFASTDSARYFFNAGGRIGLTLSRTGGTTNDKNTSWSNLLTACGTLYFTGGGSATIAGTTYEGFLKVGGSGTPTIYTTTYGWQSYTGSYANVFRQYAAASPAGYTTNYITIAVYKSSGNIYIKITLTDAAADTTVFPSGAPSNLDDVDGTLTADMNIYPPSTTYITNSWGTPTMSSTAWAGS